MEQFAELKAKVQAVGNLLRTRKVITSRDLRNQIATLDKLAKELERLGL